MPNKKSIYLDHAATTPLDPEVKQAMEPYLTEIFGNPSSLHSFGQKAREGIDDAREKAAEFLSCSSQEIIFTSGATESDNLAIRGTINYLKKQNKFAKERWHIITTKIEHPAVLEVCQELQREGAEVTYLPVGKDGIIKLEDLKQAIKDNTVLVSLMYVNNEVGTIQPIVEAGEIIKEVKEVRKKSNGLPLVFHTDAVQAVNYCNCDVNYLGVDMLSLSGHKIYGPKGVGALYLRKGTSIAPLQYGGHQELGIRSGTENVAGIVGLGKAIELLLDKKSLAQTNAEIKQLRDQLVVGILKAVPNSALNGDQAKRIPANASFSFQNVEGESILLMMDMEGIAVSTGSACSSGSLEPSHVLLAMGIPKETCHGSLRITLGKDTTEAEIKRVLEVLPLIIKKLRSMSPVKSHNT